MSQAYKARVFVTLKPSVFDPQGRTITDALQSMGYGTIGDVRQGKFFELQVSAESKMRRRRWPVKWRTSCSPIR